MSGFAPTAACPAVTSNVDPVTKRTLAVAALALVLLLGLAPSASAHAQLESTTPAAGSILNTAPDTIELSFSEHVTVDSVKVIDAGRHRVDTGKTTKLDGRTVRAALKPKLPDGGYVVAWRVVSADSHPIGGGFTFRVGSSSTALDPSLVQNLLAGTKAPRSLGVVYGLVRFVLFSGLLLLVGGAAFVAMLWPEGASRDRVRTILWWSLDVVAVTTALGLGLQGASVGGLGLLDALKPSVIGDTLGTSFGHVWLARLLLLMPAAVLLQSIDRVRTSAWRAAAAVVGIALVTTPALSGHADTGRWVAWATLFDVAHVGSGAVWLGGLTMLLAVVLRTDVTEARDVTERFSAVAFGAVSVVVVTGTFQSFRQLGSLDGFDTTYGHLLIVKVVLVLTLLGVASLTRSALHGRLPIGDLEPVGAGPGAQHVEEHDVITVLRRLVAAEVVIAILVVAVTSLLVDANPSGALAARGGPFDQTHVVSDALVNVVVVPGVVGPTDIHLYVDNPAGGLTQPVGVTATLSLPSGGVTGIDVPFVTAGPKHWTANDVDVPIAGTWQLEVEVLLTDIDKATTTFNVPIGGSS
ncbi:MAG: copper transport protein [Actinomycetota bacterium]|nr:copper transport protein [Actinomycetota bacterium]